MAPPSPLHCTILPPLERRTEPSIVPLTLTQDTPPTRPPEWFGLVLLGPEVLITFAFNGLPFEFAQYCPSGEAISPGRQPESQLEPLVQYNRIDLSVFV